MQNWFSIFVHSRFGQPLFTAADLHNGFLYRSSESFILAAFRPQNLFLHHRDIDHMKMIMEHVLAKCFGHRPVNLVSVHDCREDILFTANNLHSGFIGFLIKLSGVFITAGIVEVRRVHIKDHFVEMDGIRLQTSGGNDVVSFHLLKHFSVAPGRFFEVYVEGTSFRDNIFVTVYFFFTLIVCLCISDVIICDIHISCTGTVNSVISCHIFPSFLWDLQTGSFGEALLRKCNNPL